ncbi:hypothetical protein B0H13DRAFT_1855951 [Mycena leptocephala]|nr:hypothetical protein B0H13DRAFT_1855951 [Mycena leptocephala]
MRRRRQVNICAQADGVADNVKAVAGSRGIAERFFFLINLKRPLGPAVGGTAGAINKIQGSRLTGSKPTKKTTGDLECHWRGVVLLEDLKILSLVRVADADSEIPKTGADWCRLEALTIGVDVLREHKQA